MQDALQDRYGPFMTIADVSEALNIEKQTLYNQSCKGDLEIPHVKMGKRILFPTAGVGDYLLAKLAS